MWIGEFNDDRLKPLLLRLDLTEASRKVTRYRTQTALYVLAIKTGRWSEASFDPSLAVAEDTSSGGGSWSSHHDFAHGISGKQFKLCTGLDNKYITVFANEIKLSIRGHR